ncbi:response regulator [Tenacibaculum sp. TC6]|uniref:response regulator n=1 Tax=Tenacibaculum sp. TC6 TaxID=3423223 RepID=UPI003D36704A
MKKLYLFKLLIVFELITLLSCQSYKEKYEVSESITTLSEKEFDSVRNILVVNNKPYQVSKTIHQLIKELEIVKNPHELAKRYRLIAGYFMLTSDFKNADTYLKKLEEYYKDFEKWNEYVSLSKTIAMSYRGQKRYNEIEEVLKNGITIAENKKVVIYDLIPIHELSVFYSYDVGQHEKAIEYGEVFLEKLAQYDYLKINREVFNAIKDENLSVINLILGKSYTQVNELDKAYNHLKDAAEEYTAKGDLEKIERVHSNFIDYYLKKNDLPKIKEHKEKYLEYHKKHKDSLIASFKKISEAKLSLAEAEKEVLVVKESNKTKLIILSAIGALLLLAIIFERYFLKLKYEKEKISLELEKEHDFNKFRAELFMNIAHEIRTPISLILGYLDLSSEKSINNKELKKYLKEIRNKSAKVVNNISDIISLLKEEKKQEEIIMEHVIIEPFLQQLFFSFESIAKIKSIELNYEAALPINYAIQTNTNKLESLINNLVGNAIKFSPQKATVTFKVFLQDYFMHIHIIDQGSGICPESQKNIFDKFYQEDKKGKSEGFGIGLAIVKDIVDKLKGEISVVSTPEKGATFKVLFPVSTEASIESPETITKKIKGEISVDKTVINFSKQKYEVLIVEDNPYMVEYYQKIVSPFYNCTFAFNGEEGINVLKNKKIDLIISDVMMPKMNGIEFKKEIEKNSETKNIPFVMVTALGNEENKIEAFNIGVSDYIVKPFSKDELIARINCLLKNKEKREAWIQNEDEKEVESFDEKKLKKLYKIVLKNLDKEDFNVVSLAEEVNFSQRQLERIIKKLTGLTPVKFILEIRLQEAYKKIKNKEEADVNNIRYSVGIKSASYFSVKFKQRFGVSPSELLKES